MTFVSAFGWAVCALYCSPSALNIRSVLRCRYRNPHHRGSLFTGTRQSQRRLRYRILNVWGELLLRSKTDLVLSLSVWHAQKHWSPLWSPRSAARCTLLPRPPERCKYSTERLEGANVFRLVYYLKTDVHGV